MLLMRPDIDLDVNLKLHNNKIKVRDYLSSIACNQRRLKKLVPMYDSSNKLD